LTPSLQDCKVAAYCRRADIRPKKTTRMDLSTSELPNRLLDSCDSSLACCCDSNDLLLRRSISLPQCNLARFAKVLISTHTVALLAEPFSFRSILTVVQYKPPSEQQSSGGTSPALSFLQLAFVFFVGVGDGHATHREGRACVGSGFLSCE